jgi:hypothetical protein
MKSSISTEEIVDIYRNRKTGVFRIQPFAWDEHGFSQASGKQTVIEGGNPDALHRAMIENLQKNSTAKYRKMQVPKEEYQRTLKEDQLVSVKRQCKGKNWSYYIIPFRRMGASFGSVGEVSVSEREFEKNGVHHVLDAFNKMP